MENTDNTQNECLDIESKKLMDLFDAFIEKHATDRLDSLLDTDWLCENIFDKCRDRVFREYITDRYAAWDIVGWFGSDIILDELDNDDIVEYVTGNKKILGKIEDYITIDDKDDIGQILELGGIMEVLQKICRTQTNRHLDKEGMKELLCRFVDDNFVRYE